MAEIEKIKPKSYPTKQGTVHQERKLENRSAPKHKGKEKVTTRKKNIFTLK